MEISVRFIYREKERERERDYVKQCMGERERERESMKKRVLVGVWERNYWKEKEIESNI